MSWLRTTIEQGVSFVSRLMLAK